MFTREMINIWDRFNERFARKGMSLLIKDDPIYKSAGFGSIAIPKDKWAPTISLHVFTYDNKVSIEVNDRRGDPIVGSGRTVGYYRLSSLDPDLLDKACDNIEEVFKDFGYDHPIMPSFELIEINL